ncbi:MAG: hypothetical protein U1C33_01730, partial [Candidatus Cloacimonadaceae bacterium]|nr:hypothetical protein [Candidatus Cloacimonadaceae bacterium]
MSFMFDNILYLISSGPFGNSLVRLHRDGDGTLSIAWIQSLPFYYGHDIFMEDDRVSFWGVDGTTFVYKLYTYTPGITNWVLVQQRELDWDCGLFALGDQYLAIGIDRILYLDSNMNPLESIQTATLFYYAQVVNEPYVLLHHIGDLKEIYDLETESWLDFSTSYQPIIPNRSVNTNQIIFYSDIHFQVLTFNENGTHTINSFSLPEAPIAIDVWGDRMLCFYQNSQESRFVIYQIQGNSYVEIANELTDHMHSRISFYSYDHFVCRWFNFADNTRNLSFIRITPAGNFEEFYNVQPPYLSSFFVTDMVVASIGTDTPIYNISNPDNPIQISTLSLPLTNVTTISADGAGHYLFGPDGYGKYIIANQDFEFTTSFRGRLHQYISSNKMLVLSANQLIFLEHGELTDINDPAIPSIPEQIC